LFEGTTYLYRENTEGGARFHLFVNSKLCALVLEVPNTCILCDLQRDVPR